MNAEKPRCQQTKYESYFRPAVQCTKPGKVQRDGVWYCGVHDPERIAARRNASYAKWRREADVAAWQTKLSRLKDAISDAVLAGLDPAPFVADYRSHERERPDG